MLRKLITPVVTVLVFIARDYADEAAKLELRTQSILAAQSNPN